MVMETQTHTAAGAAREHLQSLVNRAEQLLATRGAFFTNGAKLAISDMIKDAVLALEGKSCVPFVRNRQFYSPREDEAIQFAAKRYTMTPSYNYEGKVFHEYGLEPALAWFEQQDMMYGGAEQLPGRAEFVLANAESLLQTAVIGGSIGQYDEAASTALRGSMERLAEARNRAADDGENLAIAIVDSLNRLRDFRYSRVLRTDIDPASTLYLTDESLESVKANIAADPLLKNQYEQIAALAELYSLDYIEKASLLLMDEAADYHQINESFYAWSSTDKIVNFKAPDRAVKASLSFVLPAEENEADGLGHVWIDHLDILSASGGSLDILNGGFDEGELLPNHWRAVTLRGNPELRWESEYPYCGGGDRCTVGSANPSSQVSFASKEGSIPRSIFMCNPTREDESAWTYDKAIAVESGIGYTLTFAAKIDGKFKRGVKTVITFMDEGDQVVDTFEYWFNRRSSLPNGCFQLTMQCDAIQYAITQDKSYALKAKHALMYTLNDFCQGAEHWLVMNSRPQGSDSYGAVQGGRLLCSAAVTYSIIKAALVLTVEEKSRFYSMVEYLLRYMLDLRDRTELSLEDAQRGCSNWQTDMCAGTAYMMLVLDDFPNRKTWLYNAHMVLQAQLELNVNPDHSWPESIRYHHAALERFAGYAKVVSHGMGENWFASTRLAEMFDFSIHMQTPGYAYFYGRIGTPPFGDHALTGGSEFGSYITYLEDIEKVDKRIADRMYETWVRAGKPFKKFWGEAIALDNILGKGDAYEASSSLHLQSTKSFPDAGIYVFRNDFGEGKQSYFAIMASSKPIAHEHLDQGSFILYKNSVPLVMDSGIEGYFDSSTSWHISSYSHACVQFATRQTQTEKSGNGTINLSAGTYSLERGWVDVPRSSKVLDCTLGEDIERITIEIMNPEGQGKHIRDVHYMREHDLYVIRDTIEDFEGDVLFSLPVAAKHTANENAKFISEGHYDVDLETVFVSKLKRSWIEKGRSTPFMPTPTDNASMMDYVRAVADAKEGFLTILYPRERDGKRLTAASYEKERMLIKLDETQIEIRFSSN